MLAQVVSNKVLYETNTPAMAPPNASLTKPQRVTGWGGFTPLGWTDAGLVTRLMGDTASKEKGGAGGGMSPIAASEMLLKCVWPRFRSKHASEMLLKYY
jgi:hypothetical protein